MKEEKIPRSYKILKEWIRFVVNTVYFKKANVIDVKNVPAEGTPLLIVSDHQNSLTDALGIMLSLNDRKVHFITRADVFSVHPLATKFLYWLGLLPAFRLNFEGAEALSKNDSTFKVSEQNLLDGRTVVIYPEAGHQDKHWLGNFTYGYTRMAFGAAELGGFKTDVKILPSCNHYDEYYDLRTQQVIRYGTPISLEPYYELYKTKPRTAQRQVNALVRKQIKDMMLSIDDVEHYAEIDYLRNSVPGRQAAIDANLDPDDLAQKLTSDKAYVGKLAGSGKSYESVTKLLDSMKKLRVNDSTFDNPPSLAGILGNCLILLLLLPFAIFALWPTVLCYFIPEYLSKKVGDKMLRSSFLLGMNILFILPICGLITLHITGFTGGWIRAIAYTLLLPFIACFEWYYYKFAVNTAAQYRYYKAEKEGKIAPVKELRDKVHSEFTIK